jgi:hypothetical protein
MPNGPLRITEFPFDLKKYSSEHVLPKELQELVDTPLRPKKKK